MKFALNKEYGNHTTNDRVTAFTAPYDYFRTGKKKDTKFNINALILTTKDFDINSNDVQFVTDSCSVQYRPKALHSNTKGIFYKLSGKPIYLNPDELLELNEFINKCNDEKEKLIIR